MNKPLIIFDLDGTLAHTGPDLLGTLNRVTAPHGVSPLDLDDLSYVLGQGAMAMIAKSFEKQQLALSPELQNQLLVEFLDDYRANICNETVLFDGVSSAIDELEKEGFEFAVCTNKSEEMARLLIDKLGLTHRFKSLTGGDTFDFRKPDARHLIETATKAGNDIKNAIMIGDSKADIGAALNASIPSIAVTFGYSDIAPHDLGADIVIDHFNQLPEAARKLNPVRI